MVGDTIQVVNSLDNYFAPHLWIELPPNETVATHLRIHFYNREPNMVLQVALFDVDQPHRIYPLGSYYYDDFQTIDIAVGCFESKMIQPLLDRLIELGESFFQQALAIS